MRRFSVPLFLLALFIVSGVASATTVTIGSSTTSNCFPFGSCYVNASYQQVYSSASFSGPISLTNITFFSGGTSAISGNFTLDLSITTAGVDGLSSNQAQNIGIDSAQFFSGTVTNSYTFAGTPYIYDPSLGNLLLTVTGQGTGDSYFASGTSSGTSRAFQNSSTHVYTVGSDGLETQFTGTPVAVTPEPSSLLLLGTGLVAAAGFVRRRRTQPLSFLRAA